MIISSGRSYVFVHIPKTGGTSLSLALECRAMKDDLFIGDTPKAQRRKSRLKNLSPKGRLWKHSTLADIDGILTAAQLDDMFTFTMVRNPWDRMVSYYHWLRSQGFDHPAVQLAQRNDFNSFIRHPETRGAMRQNPAGRYMTTAQGAQRCDLYIRLEHFSTDAAPLFDHLGFSLTLPHENSSDRGAYQDYYDSETEQIVGNDCTADIARFGYVF